MSERGNLWIILAILAGVSYAFNNFFLGQLAKEGILAVVYVNIPAFTFFICIYLVNCIRNKLLHGFYWSRESSIFFKDEDNSLDMGMVMAVVFMATAKFIAFYFVIVTFAYATEAGMNLGVITVIFNFTCISDTIVFYFCFNERLTKG